MRSLYNGHMSFFLPCHLIDVGTKYGFVFTSTTQCGKRSNMCLFSGMLVKFQGMLLLFVYFPNKSKQITVTQTLRASSTRHFFSNGPHCFGDLLSNYKEQTKLTNFYIRKYTIIAFVVAKITMAQHTYSSLIF